MTAQHAFFNVVVKNAAGIRQIETNILAAIIGIGSILAQLGKYKIFEKTKRSTQTNIDINSSIRLNMVDN
jgi:hypothetical protein